MQRLHSTVSAFIQFLLQSDSPSHAVSHPYNVCTVPTSFGQVMLMASFSGHFYLRSRLSQYRGWSMYWSVQLLVQIIMKQHDGLGQGMDSYFTKSSHQFELTWALTYAVVHCGYSIHVLPTRAPPIQICGAFSGFPHECSNSEGCSPS